VLRQDKGPFFAVGRKGGETMLPKMIIDSLQSTIGQHIEPIFANCVKRQRTGRWVMFSDYVLSHRVRPNETFVFTGLVGACRYAWRFLGRENQCLEPNDFTSLRK
jgi:hypothetical protein